MSQHAPVFCARRPTARDLRQSDCPSMLRFSARRGVLLAICPSMLRSLHFYGESANAIKIQIWVTLIANLLLMVMRKGLTRQWSFSGLATMVRITLMYYVDFHSLFNNPEKEWEIILSEASGAPPEPSLFD